MHGNARVVVQAEKSSENVVAFPRFDNMHNAITWTWTISTTTKYRRLLGASVGVAYSHRDKLLGSARSRLSNFPYVSKAIPFDSPPTSFPCDTCLCSLVQVEQRMYLRRRLRECIYFLWPKRDIGSGSECGFFEVTDFDLDKVSLKRTIFKTWAVSNTVYFWDFFFFRKHLGKIFTNAFLSFWNGLQIRLTLSKQKKRKSCWKFLD